MVDSETKDFFVSYNSADRAWAEWIAWVFEEKGYSVIIQAWDFRPGGNFILDMQRATEAERTVMVLSDAYLQASYTQPEWAAAFKQDPESEARKLLPIRVSPCQPQGMLAPVVYVDLVGKTETEAEELLMVALQERAKPRTRPVFPQEEAARQRVTPKTVSFPGTTAEFSEPAEQAEASERSVVQPLVGPHSSKVSKADWLNLFDNFSGKDFAYVQIAFLCAFKVVYGDFWTIRPDHPQLSELAQIRNLLTSYDNPQLAVQFVGQAIVELQRASEDEPRDLTFLQRWRETVAEVHGGIALTKTEPIVPGINQGYLLLALKESGRVTKEGASVTVFSGLHATGVSNSIEWDADTITCSLDQVAEHLSDLIHKAEEVLSPYGCGRITVELFLPCVYLEENVADWEVQNEQQRPRSLGRHRGFVVRSLDRVFSKPTQTVLSQNWQLLEDCVKAQKACERFHLQDTCPEPGDLEVFLEEQPGLKLVADLPEDSEQRQDILYDIINSAVPIALWSSPACDGTTDERLTEFETLLSASQLTDFANLAQQWRRRRIQVNNMTAKQLRLLCDCPERWPQLPDKRREDDLLVAS
ncbi:TIR domain-containing protein [Leptothoe spongobia]|uniref:Toll/interleukin-1 receptor domain-containing protein n=1 Tax=Leptothoe spongobia TAU-MAC 1115 TaxID=1967444 RepID=A0A947GJU6_9CYAN|nr:TIR domain-containing protein [Leptothoe spongobia]MBT9317305.1 toll/interleukin-1 receptor domain-containing protein [Leptothoe spongobia TAU-MAC 1115]